ncbi:hypothetical protein N9K16_04635 [Alphaproteobacteria bacterium]|nr:hypothetical protein [Alphaproteobacteria bacterium]
MSFIKAVLLAGAVSLLASLVSASTTSLETANFTKMPTATTSVFQLASAKGQCMSECEDLDNACRKIVKKLGDANGWDGDLRQDDYDDRCAAATKACFSECGCGGDDRLPACE